MPSKTLLVFPTSRAIRTYVAQDSSNRLLSPLLTLDSFFSKSISLGTLSYIKEEHRFLLLKESTHIDNFSQLGISNTFNDFIKQSDYIFRFFNELSAENVSIDSIKQADTYEFYEEHLGILETIYSNYTALLDKYHFVDTITLPKHYELNVEYLKNFETIFVYFEGYFTHFEFTLLGKIAQYVSLHIQLQTNTYNKKSYEKFIQYGFELKEGFTYVLDMSQKKILHTQTTLSLPLNIEIKGFSQRINQIAFVKKSITTMIENGLHPSEIALIVPDESFVGFLDMFDTEGYFNFAMGKEIKTSTLYTKAYAIYEYCNESEKKHHDYIAFLKLSSVYLDETFKSSWNKQITQSLFAQLIEFLKKDEPNEELIHKFDEECYTLHHLIFNYKEPIAFKEAYKFLLQRLSSLKTDDINSGVITVMGLLETRAICFKGVIIVDFNEDTVPKKSIKDKFLSTNVKKHAQLPTRKERENLQKYYYHTLCKNASVIYVSYVKNETQSISRFASELFNCPEDEMLYDHAYQSILYAPNSLTHFNQEIILDIDLSKQEWSATSLKTYLHCKRKYYLHYLAHIKEHHFSLKPQSFEIGSAIHSILETFYSSVSYLDCDVPNTILNSYFNAFKKQNPFMFLDFEIWKRKLEHFIEHEKKEFLSKQKRVYKTEMPFKFVYEGVILKGVIDRIDKGKDFFEIIDYKTSSTLSVDTSKNYEKSVDFQLEFYFLAMKAYLEKSGLTSFSITPYYYDLNKATLLEEQALDEKIGLLKEKLHDLKTTEVSFTQCLDLSICTYCPYTIICNR